MPRRFPFPVLCLLLAAAVPSLRADSDPLATLRPGHPRLLADGEAAWAEIAALRRGGGDGAALLGRIVAAGRQIVPLPVCERRLTGRRLLGVSREVFHRVAVLGLAYRIEGDKVFAQRAEAELLAAAAFPDWNPGHFLDVAEMTAALALGYDWLFDVLPPASRETVRRAIVDKGLRPGLDPGAKHNFWHRIRNNWNQVCLGGLTLGALAVADEEPGLARSILGLARANIGIGLEPYAPDGVYPEGPNYWGFGTTYQVMMIAALESALGTDWGLSGAPGFLAGAGAYLQCTGPTDLAFNFGDGSETVPAQPALFWFARRLREPGLLAGQMARLAEEAGAKQAETLRFFPFVGLWWPRDTGGSGAPRLPLRWLGRGETPVGVFRSAWGEPRASYLAFKGGAASQSHAHMDAGSFVFEADGVRWARDLGMQNYHSLESKGVDLWNRKQVSQRWTIFRLNHRSHNTLTIDDAPHRVEGRAEIVGFSDAPEAPRAVVDLSPVFAGQATAVRRGFRLLRGREALIQDEIVGAGPAAVVRWAMVTGAEVVVERNCAVLRQGAERLDAVLLAPTGAEFSVIPADPPDDGINAPNPGRRILIAKVPADAAGRATVAVWLKPGSAAGASAPELVPLSEWNLPGLPVGDRK